MAERLRHCDRTRRALVRDNNKNVVHLSRHPQSKWPAYDGLKIN
jgi:hypothetical protein